MRLERADRNSKGWLAGPWDSELAISIGYANQGIDEPHVHRQITEIYLVARGTALIRVGSQTIELISGDVIIVEPGEAHTFLSSSYDYFHYVIHTPGLSGEQAKTEKYVVSHEDLGL
jgi:mannose-6-phosphate isomerase-like protein (cupin superfamily)